MAAPHREGQPRPPQGNGGGRGGGSRTQRRRGAPGPAQLRSALLSPTSRRGEASRAEPCCTVLCLAGPCRASPGRATPPGSAPLLSSPPRAAPPGGRAARPPAGPAARQSRHGARRGRARRGAGRLAAAAAGGGGGGAGAGGAGAARGAVPLPALHGGAPGRLPPGRPPALPRAGAGAGLRLLPGVRPPGGRGVRCLHAALRRRLALLPRPRRRAAPASPGAGTGHLRPPPRHGRVRRQRRAPRR